MRVATTKFLLVGSFVLSLFVGFDFDFDFDFFRLDYAFYRFGMCMLV